MAEFDPEAIFQSWERVKKNDDFALRFYAILFRAHPELRGKFPVIMDELRAKLTKTLDVVIGAVHDGKLQSKARAIKELGAKHAHEYGVLKAHYGQVGGALLATLGHYDPQWSEDLLNDWSEAYGVVAEVMLEGAPEEVAA